MYEISFGSQILAFFDELYTSTVIFFQFVEFWPKNLFFGPRQLVLAKVNIR